MPDCNFPVSLFHRLNGRGDLLLEEVGAEMFLVVMEVVGGGGGEVV